MKLDCSYSGIKYSHNNDCTEYYFEGNTASLDAVETEPLVNDYGSVFGDSITVTVAWDKDPTDNEKYLVERGIMDAYGRSHDVWDQKRYSFKHVS